MTEVSLTTKERSHFANARPMEVSLVDEYETRPQPLVCRTCTKTSNKLWAYTPNQLREAQADPDVNLDDLKCWPDKLHSAVKVLNTTDPRNRIVSMDTESIYRTRAFVDTCGHNIRPECLRCDRFVPIEVPIAYPANRDTKISWVVEKVGDTERIVPVSNDGSRVRMWNVAVGGSCSLPVEGIVRNGKTVFCDPVAKGKRIESPSCANCFYADYAGDSWQFDYLEVNENAALTPYEREQVLLANANSPEPMSIGQAYGLALWRKQTEGYGRQITYAAEVLKKGMHRGVMKYKIRFIQNRVTAIVTADNPNCIVHENTLGDHYDVTDPDCGPMIKVPVEIKWPYNRTFGLNDMLKVTKRRWPALPDRIRVPNPGFAELVNDRCPRCNPKRGEPCYYHAKDPKRNTATREITFTRSNTAPYTMVLPEHAKMKVIERNGEIIAVDGNGNLPEAYGEKVANASVFRQCLPELLRKARAKYGKRGVNSITSQYHQVTGMLHYARPMKVRPSWLRNGTTEPAKPRCTHPNGLNLRKVFMDSFGSERADIDYDMGAQNTALVEEEIRVGKRQHNQTPQRLHEEILATITSHPRYREEYGGIVPYAIPWPDEDQMTVTKLEGIGGMTREDGTPVTDPAEFMDRLDDIVEIGMAGEMPRRISVRQQLFGYDMSRGYYGARRGHEKTAMPAFDNEMAIFADHEEPDQVDMTDAWRCPECDKRYDTSEIDDFFNPECECGSALYKNHTSRVSYNARATGGIGNALAMDSDATRQRQMMYATLCPNWRFSYGDIRLDDLPGSIKSSVTETPVEVRPVQGPTVHKIGGFLSDEHKAANAAYEVKRNKVYAEREAYKTRFPDTTIAELERKFPLPDGTIYVEKAAGSLSKMGGM